MTSGSPQVIADVLGFVGGCVDQSRQANGVGGNPVIHGSLTQKSADRVRLARPGLHIGKNQDRRFAGPEELHGCFETIGGVVPLEFAGKLLLFSGEPSERHDGVGCRTLLGPQMRILPFEKSSK